jgi:hypothetical protein
MRISVHPILAIPTAKEKNHTIWSEAFSGSFR